MARMPSMHCWRITGSLLTQEIPSLYSSHGDPHTSRNHCRSVPKKGVFHRSKSDSVEAVCNTRLHLQVSTHRT